MFLPSIDYSAIIKAISNWGIVMPIFAIVTALIFSPDVRLWTGLDNFYVQFRPWISLAWMFLSARIAWQLSTAVFSRGRSWKQARNNRDHMLKTLKSLSAKEKKILSQFQDNDTQWLSMEDEAVMSLQNKKVISPAGGIVKYLGRAFEMSLGRQYQINPLAKNLFVRGEPKRG
jgi:hypothetical protein